MRIIETTKSQSSVKTIRMKKQIQIMREPVYDKYYQLTHVCLSVCLTAKYNILVFFFSTNTIISFIVIYRFILGLNLWTFSRIHKRNSRNKMTVIIETSRVKSS